MNIIGKVDSLWRYPVKSMRGEELKEAFVGFAGVYGDRIFAFKSSASPKGFPYLTGREQQQMLRYRPRFRHPDKAAKPPNLSEAEGLAPGVTPLYSDPAEMIVDVETPSEETLSIDDPALISLLGEGIRDAHIISLLRSERALTDLRPVSLFSIQTAQQIGDELGVAADKRRFRANIYVDLASAGGFGEDALVGRSLRIGAKAVLSILERDPRCKMITLDPDTGEANPGFIKKVAQAHDGKAGVYAAVLVEGTVRQGDPIELMG
ncbi:MAG TPA: MOSC domain-containing protein [Blastocatellia bacterium]|nr:MOSC domain-containing protein [Blastocatellia bacterium]